MRTLRWQSLRRSRCLSARCRRCRAFRRTSCTTSRSAKATTRAKAIARSARAAIRRRCRCCRRCSTATCRRSATRPVLIVKGDKAIDAATGAGGRRRCPTDRDDVVVNNRLRRELDDGASRRSSSSSPDRAVRLAAAKELQSSADEDALPAIAAGARQGDRSGDQEPADADAGVDPAREHRHARRGSPPSARSRKATPAPRKTLLLGVAREEGRQVRRARRRDPRRSASAR